MYRRRMVKMLITVMVLITLPGCFLFGGGGDDNSTENAITASKEIQNNAQISDEALFLAEMALESEDYDTAVSEYNRAIRADSTNVDAYLGLTRLHQALALQYREAGDVEAALQEQTRALRILNTYIGQHLIPAAATSGVEVLPPDRMEEPATEDSMMETPATESAPDTTQSTP